MADFDSLEQSYAYDLADRSTEDLIFYSFVLGADYAVESPVILPFLPASGEILPTTPVSTGVTISANNAIVRTTITVQFDDSDLIEEVYSGRPDTDGPAGYTGLYLGTSQVYAITLGFGFVFLRRGGWRPNPVFHAVAYSATGGEAEV